MKHALIILLFATLLKGNLFAQSSNGSLLSRAFFKKEWSGELVPTDLGHYVLKKDNPRLVAIMLNISLGMFGVHRMYLGTDIKVPILYTVTLGGGTVLWLVDLGLLIASKDISPYMNNPHFFMWTKE